MGNLKIYINNPEHGNGQADIGSDNVKTYRPDWDEIRDFIKGEKSLNDVGCE